MKDLVAAVRKQNLFSPGETVVAAVSGGADSVALLDILTRLDLDLNLVVAHLNHCLRGADSDADEAFVSALAARYNVAFAAKRVDVAALAAEKRLSLEDAGRRARYAFLEETAKEHGAACIVVAHHLDDQAETVLMRLLRGAGGGGLSAMASSRQSVKRPLLQIPRSALERYLKERGLNHRTDASNADTDILRNSIRHELVPFLRRYNPKVSERLAATARILAADEELLDQVTETAFARMADAVDGSVTLPLPQLLKEPKGLRLRLYRRSLVGLRGDLLSIGEVHLESVDRLVRSNRSNARLKLPGDCFVSRCYDRLGFESTPPSAPSAWRTEIPGEGVYPLPDGRRFLVQRVERPLTLEGGCRTVAHLSPESVPFPWLLRSFAPGDRFTPLGMEGTQKIKDLFINEKIPPSERSGVPIVVSGGEVVWVAGVRTGEIGRVRTAAGAVLRVEIL